MFARYETLTNTPVDRCLTWTSEFIKKFSYTVGVSRHTQRTANLKRGDSLHTQITNKIKRFRKLCYENVEESKIRIRSVDDIFCITCPGCRQKCTLNYEGWMIVKSTTDIHHEILHITCPDLDEDVTNHVFWDKLVSGT